MARLCFLVTSRNSLTESEKSHSLDFVLFQRMLGRFFFYNFAVANNEMRKLSFMIHIDGKELLIRFKQGHPEPVLQRQESLLLVRCKVLNKVEMPEYYDLLPTEITT